MPIGMHRTTVPPGADGIVSDVDELYRLDLGLESTSTWPKADYSKGWMADTFHGVQRLAAYGTRDGKRAAFVRIPSRHATVIILANDPNADARGMSERILEQAAERITLSGCRAGQAGRLLCGSVLLVAATLPGVAGDTGRPAKAAPAHQAEIAPNYPGGPFHARRNAPAGVRHRCHAALVHPFGSLLVQLQDHERD